MKEKLNENKVKRVEVKKGCGKEKQRNGRRGKMKGRNENNEKNKRQ